MPTMSNFHVEVGLRRVRERDHEQTTFCAQRAEPSHLLGQREPTIYGTTTLADIRERCMAKAESLGFTLEFRQTNFEGELVESVHQARTDACGIIINPAAYTFTSIALLDALKTFDPPKIELHISNVHARESIYHNSLISRIATAIMIGFGADGYDLAIQAMAGMVRRIEFQERPTGKIAMNYKLDFTPVIDGLPSLLLGCLGTFLLAICGMLLAIVIGIGGVALRDSPSSRCAGWSSRFVELIRNTPFPGADILSSSSPCRLPASGSTRRRRRLSRSASMAAPTQSRSFAAASSPSRRGRWKPGSPLACTRRRCSG